MQSSGIYIIFSKRYPGRMYVGSAFDFAVRKKVHISQLFHNNHHNVIMQNHFNKYGLADFYFCILEPCDREVLLSREQHYIDTLKPFFNINPVAGSRAGSKHSEFTKRKIRSSWRKRKPISQLSRLRGRFQSDS